MRPLLFAMTFLIFVSCGPGDLRVRQLTIVDKQGTDRIKLEVDPEDVARIGFMGKEGSVPMSFSYKEGNALITLSDGRHNGFVILTTSALGHSLSFIDSNLKTRLSMTLDADGPEVNVKSDTGDQIIALRSVNRGSTGLVLNHDRKLRIGAIVNAKGVPLMGMYGDSDRVIWQP